MKRAVIYLRVSTSAQADTDVDPEGFSLPAQRDACQRKADSLAVEVVDEYVDRGESARSADRPALQRLLARIQEQRDVDYLIVHKVDRLARSREDDVLINVALRAGGVQLVSVSENIDETPSGKLLHGIMATISEFYSSNLAAEALKGMTQKAKVGGTPNRAPIGYLNVRDKIDGREVRTVVVDPDRAPLVQLAFELYASGDWSLRPLLDELTRRGLRTVPTPKCPSQPLQLSKLAKLLSNRYYVGVVPFKGLEYPGRHVPLVSPELFERTQVVLGAHANGGERHRRHHHYLKGTVFCARCQGRLSLMPVTGRGGRYVYFFCLGRQRGSGCGQRHVQVEQVEEAVIDYWRIIQLEPERVEKVRARMREEIDRRRQTSRRDAKGQERRIERLRAERRKLLQAHYESAIPLDLLKEEQRRITTDMSQAEAMLEHTTAQFDRIERMYDQALDLVTDCQEAYRQAGPQLRRLFNHIFWNRLWLWEGKVVTAELAEPFAGLLANDLAHHYQRDAEDPGLVLVGQGSSNEDLVGEGGLEPPHPFGHRNLNPARLPIPPLARRGRHLTGCRPRGPLVPG